MAKKPATRWELLNRWKDIDEEDANLDIAGADSSEQNRHMRRKEEWFLDAFNLLISLPREKHIWCGHHDLMGPLLETFYNYFKDERGQSPIKLLWIRISEELQQCTNCIYQHHQAQKIYFLEYELDTVGPLIEVLRHLDEERVTQHLKEINARIVQGNYVPSHNDAEIVNVMLEVLMFPMLLDSQSLVTEFQLFIESIDDMHDLAFAGQQKYLGVYALLFFKSSRARSIGRRLAEYMGKLRSAADLEPLQPLLEKCMAFLETGKLQSTSETPRPRMQLDSTSVWHGINALLGFLECSAFEEGILERYPIFLSIVLNHISDESYQFLYAAKCLKRLFEMLGCKLWLRSTLSASLMRNTLLGQCFHTQNEQSHKEIFDLFQPLLQSLEALQDGEHEAQRRHFLYFLLHQVTASSNFSNLMKKKARQIALLIIHRGYKMSPPCPPFECAHIWAPSLVASLKDSSLHSSLRQPAFDLIQTIIVSDAAAMLTMLISSTSGNMCGNVFIDLGEANLDGGLLFPFAAEEDKSSWKEFSEQGEIASLECNGWMCIPMLWLDVLVGISPSVLTISFSKAVFWARSWFSMVEPENNAEMSSPVEVWLSSNAAEISASLGWKAPTGCDDGGHGRASKNSAKLSMVLVPLVRAFKRLVAHFVVQMEGGKIWKQWTWEPMMGESLMLLLIDPNDSVRHVSKCILEQFSSARGLTSGLQFLCSCKSSQSAIFLGLQHAFVLLKLDSGLSNFQALHHFFFVLCKILKDGSTSSQSTSYDSSLSRFSSEGGFLRQPVVDSSPLFNDKHQSDIGLEAWEKFSYLLAEKTWPIICKCLVVGKAFIDSCYTQMTCVRVLEILPVAFQIILASFHKFSENSTAAENIFNFKWLTDLIDWGKSSVKVVLRYWRQTVVSLMEILKPSWNDQCAAIVKTIENILSSDCVAIDELAMHVGDLSVSLSKEVFYKIRKAGSNSKLSTSGGLLFVGKPSTSYGQPLSLMDEVQVISSLPVAEKIHNKDIIYISDDDMEQQISSIEASQGHNESKHHGLDPSLVPAADGKSLQSDIEHKNAPNTESSQNILIGSQQKIAAGCTGFGCQKNFAASAGMVDPASLLKQESIDSEKEVCVNDSLPLKCKTSSKGSSDEIVSSQILNLVPEKDGRIMKDHRLLATKPIAPAAKRKAVQLNLPVQNKSAHLHRLEAGIRRFRPPNLDDWYRPILEIDYFAVVGLSSASAGADHGGCKLKEVPISFQSPEQYVEIFRPLVLEEFKAQLQRSFAEISTLEDMHCGSLSILSVERIDNFQLVRCTLNEDNSAACRNCSENDLILLTRQPLKNPSHDVHLLGKVERFEKDMRRRLKLLYIRFCLQNGSLRFNQARRLLAERSKWYLSRIMSITPQLREFQALSSVKYIPLLPIILKPDSVSPDLQESHKLNLGKLSQPLQQTLKSSYNDGQLQAISVAIGSPNSKGDLELSLIQGPPGTGKTRTIVAIVSSLVALYSTKSRETRNYPCGNVKSDSTFNTNLKSSLTPSAAIARAWQDAAVARQLNQEEKSFNKAGSFKKGRILICAQSNAAVDELVSRVSTHGLYGFDGKLYKPYLVRVGNTKTVHPDSLPVHIDTLVDNRLAQDKINASDVGNLSCGDSSSALRSNLEKLVDGIRFYEAKRASLRDKNSSLESSLGDEGHKRGVEKEVSGEEIEAKLKMLYSQKHEISRTLASTQGREKRETDKNREQRYKLRKSILKEAEIVVTTLSGCGGDLYEVCSECFSGQKFGNVSESSLFNAVVIDEAAQALEPATLIPLQLLRSRGAKCIMVGDPKQLPATVLSNVVSKFSYQCSLFERLQRAGYPVSLLTKQYRMHPEICGFPSMHFYDKKLINGDGMPSKSAKFHETRGLGPYVFFDVADGQEIHGKNPGTISIYNRHEADASVEILKFFRNRYPSEFSGERIGIITPYKYQLSILRAQFSSAFGSSVMADMEFNTVDGFQGREVDIVVLSTVRAANPCSTSAGIKSNIGFVADARRMNVALTRARLSLWILGNMRTLQANPNWAALVKDAMERDLVISCKKPYDSIFQISLQKNGGLQNSDRNSRQQHAKQSANLKDKSRSEVRPDSQKHRRNRSHFSAMAERGVQSNKKHKHGLSLKENVKSSGVAENDAQKGTEILGKRPYLGRSHSGNVDLIEKGSGDDDNKELTAEESSEHDGHEKVQVSASLGEGHSRSNHVETDNDLIARRKQRKAVDDLLPSAFLSSRRSGTSVKPVPAKRSPPPTSYRGKNHGNPSRRKDKPI